jgi:inhibitor of cysteine peptidase
MTTLSFDLRSSGQTVTVAAGDRLQVQLEENPTTGFRWYIEDDKSGVLILEHDAFAHLRNGVSGAGGTRELVFRVAKQGQTILRASYRRAWETQTPPHATFELTVTAN